MTSTEREVSTIEHLDFTPPCSYSGHLIFGTGAVVWVVTYANPLTHGCWLGSAVPNVNFFCEGCWRRVWAWGGSVTCIKCQRAIHINEDLLSVEPYR